MQGAYWYIYMEAYINKSPAVLCTVPAPPVVLPGMGIFDWFCATSASHLGLSLTSFIANSALFSTAYSAHHPGPVI
jgi:hypothetical protein